MDKVNQRKYDKFKEITKKMHKLYIDKNQDYGDSFKNTRDKIPHAILVRVLDKVGRLETLYLGEAKIKNETIDDTLLDLANYCIMELVERSIGEGYEKG